MKIYTKTGDSGKTSLLSGERVDKNSLRIEAYGTVDELNSFIGLAICEIKSERLIRVCTEIQNKLFNAGSLLAVESELRYSLPEISENDITFLEKEIDAMNAELPPLNKFILPGGGKSIAMLHVCRTVCRRAERHAVNIPLKKRTDELCIKYLNRLSDYLFVAARFEAFSLNLKDVYWKQ